MKSFKMHWNLPLQLLILIVLALSISTQARNLKHIHPTAVVVGTVYCDTCFQDGFFRRSSHFISGATVSVECKNAAFKAEVKTNDKGEFKAPLPFSVNKHDKEIKGCQVRLVKSSEPHCAIASTTNSTIWLKSHEPGARVFSAGFLFFKPLNQPDQCNHQTTATNPDEPIRPQFFFPPVFPPIFPSPPPAITIPLPPNPLQPPPLIPLPPIPLQPPSPPPFGLPHIPGLPGLTPSPPPPSPLPIPFPPIVPIPPLPPIIPGVPPAKKVSP